MHQIELMIALAQHMSAADMQRYQDIIIKTANSAEYSATKVFVLAVTYSIARETNYRHPYETALRHNVELGDLPLSTARNLSPADVQALLWEDIVPATNHSVRLTHRGITLTLAHAAREPGQESCWQVWRHKGTIARKLPGYWPTAREAIAAIREIRD